MHAVRRDEAWRRHIQSVGWPVVATIALQVVELLLLPIPSEVSPLDQTLSGSRRPHRALAILLSAAPSVLAFGTPCAAVLRLRLPLRLSHHPPSSTRAAALGLLLTASVLSVVSVLVLRNHLSAIRSGASAAPCMQAPFSTFRLPISLSILLLAIALTWLLPSLSGLLGSAWLALHLDRQSHAEEAVLAARFGTGWTAYSAGVPRWLDLFSGAALLVSSVVCGCWHLAGA